MNEKVDKSEGATEKVVVEETGGQQEVELEKTADVPRAVEETQDDLEESDGSA